MVRDLHVSLQTSFAVVRDHGAGFCSAASNPVETHSVMLHQGVWSILTHLDGRLVSLASKPSVKTSSDTLGIGKAPPLSILVKSHLRSSTSYSGSAHQ